MGMGTTLGLPAFLKRDSNEEGQQSYETKETCANSGVVQVTTREIRAKANCLHDK